MSLYNMLFGTNEEMPVLLGMIGVNTEYFDRFRDVDLIENGTKIRVLTRLGGGNREDYEDTWEKIREHELYITDYDNDFDCTYAYVEFNIPDKFKETAKKMFKGEPISVSDKFNNEIKEMGKEGTKANEKAKQIAQEIENAINNTENDGGNIHIIKL